MDGDADAQVGIHGVSGWREAVVLCIIGADGPPMGDPVVLQDVAFLVSNTVPHILGGTFGFAPGEYGPRSGDIDRIVRDLVDAGLVDPGLGLTGSGRRVHGPIRDGLDGQLVDAIGFWRTFAVGPTRDELLTFMHASFPETVTDPESVRRISGDREANTVSLVAKGSISAGRGAEILGMGYHEFGDLLIRKGVRWKS